MSYEKIKSEGTITLAADETVSDSYLIAKDISQIIVQVIFPTAGTGSASIETCLATVKELKAGTTVDADWKIWDDGTVTADTPQIVASAPAAIRVKNDGGTTVKVRVKGNFGS